MSFRQAGKNSSSMPTPRPFPYGAFGFSESVLEKPGTYTDGGYGLDLAGSEPCVAAKVPRLAREVEKMNSQEATFAQKLRALMETKQISQQELADRAHCSQPAISQMLNRACRPQKKTILKLAEALNVNARDLWPDIHVAEALDAVASFQQPGYVMTPEEAQAFSDTSKRNPPKVQAKALPTRPRKKPG